MNNRIALLGHSQVYARSLRNLGDHLDFYNKLEEPKRNKYVKDRFYESYSGSLQPGVPHSNSSR